MSNVLTKATEFISKVTGKASALDDVSKRIKAQISTLEAERAEVMASYDVDGGGLDTNALERIDADLRRYETELKAVQATRAATPDKDAAQAVTMIDALKAEADEVLADKIAEDERIRAEILAAKDAYFAKLREHAALVDESKHVTDDYNAALRNLAQSIGNEVQRLRGEVHVLDRFIYNASPAEITTGRHEAQSEIDKATAKRDELRRKITELEKQREDIVNTVKPLDAYVVTDNTKGYANKYYVYEIDAKRAGRGL
jgi:hypothetical protein